MKLYRYQPINKFTLESLLLKQNWASNPKYFNDPFEFLIPDRYKVDDKGEVKFLTHQEGSIRQSILESIIKFGVISYSSKYDNILLWSHYSAMHTGICIEFEIDETEIQNLFQVNYEKGLPDLEFNADSDIINVLTTKGEYWNYENEYRQIFSKGDKYYKQPGAITEIIFGCRTSNNDIDALLKLFDNNYEIDILFSKMSIQPNTYFLSKGTPHRKRNETIPKFWVR